MYTEINSHDEHAFNNMSEESEKKNLIVKKSLRPVPSRGVVEQAKKHSRLQTRARLPRKRFKTPDSEVVEDHEGYN